MDEAQENAWQHIRHAFEDADLSSGNPPAEIATRINRRISETLGISHLKLIPRHTPSTNAHRPASGSGHVGLELQHIDGQWLVSRVVEGTSGHSKGIRSGMQVLELDGHPLQSPSDSVLEASPDMNEWLWGPPGNNRNIRYHDGKKVRSANLKLNPWNQGFSHPLGHLPPQPLHFACRDIDQVRILHFRPFSPDLMPRIIACIKTNPAGHGLILDLRDNPGGLAFMANGIAGHLCKTPLQLGTMRMKAGVLRFPVNPQAPVFEGPLAILINQRSASASEILAAGLQESGRVKIFGQRSMGAALPSQFIAIGQAFFLQIPFATYETPSGRDIEGQGVHPDVEVIASKQDLIQGHDPVLFKAIQWAELMIQSGNSTP
jgi:carboxyl-terminal processing protease